jgi:hypothetical protein
VAILSLAASIGTALTVYGLLNTAEAPGTRDVRFVFDGPLDTRGAGSVSYPFFRRRRESGRGAAAFTPVPVRAQVAGEAVSWDAQLVSPGYFALLGTRPALGREFLCELEARQPCHEVILSDALWRARFGSDAAILGRTIRIEGQPYAVTGVGPATPGALAFAGFPDIWLPLAAAPELTGVPTERADVRWLYTLARSEAGHDPAGARSLSLPAIRLVRLLRIRSGVAQQLPAIALGCGALLVAAGAFGAGLLLRGARPRVGRLIMGVRALLFTLAGAAGAVAIHWALIRVFVRFLTAFRVPVAELDTRLNPVLLAAACLLAFATMVLTAGISRRSGEGPAT